MSGRPLLLKVDPPLRRPQHSVWVCSIVDAGVGHGELLAGVAEAALDGPEAEERCGGERRGGDLPEADAAAGADKGAHLSVSAGARLGMWSWLSSKPGGKWGNGEADRPCATALVATPFVLDRGTQRAPNERGINTRGKNKTR
jgi:hypothetical protein